MPIFNRVRIVNIRYDCREIKDELFDYYGGYNALMNLANGSGKTVMVETLFQPIYPNMSVGKWKIIDYLTGDQHPTFVMIEWLLDGTREPTYFMTGICLSFTKFPQEDQSGKALKYFTFTHTYTKGNAYDIKHIPLITENITETDRVLYFGCENIYYMVSGATIATPSVQGTTVFNEMFLSYYAEHPDKVPNVVIIDKAFIDNPRYQYHKENQFMLDWIEEEFKDAEVVETGYVTILRR